jgi:hypothetical protein
MDPITTALITAGITEGSKLLGGLFGGGGPEIPDPERVNVDDVQTVVQRIALENARRSKSMEAELDPELAALRPEVYGALREQLASRPSVSETSAVRERIMQDLLGEDVTLDLPELQSSQLLQDAIRRAEEELAMGGRIPADVQQAIFQSSQARAGQAGLAGGQAGRDITARDLGLTSLDLRNQRLGQAAQLGQVQQGMGERQQGLKAALNQFNQGLLQARRGERMSGLNFLESLRGQGIGQGLGATTAIPEPMSGLDPGSAADIFVGDINAANQYALQRAGINAQQRNANAGLMGGIAEGLGSFFGSGGGDKMFSSIGSMFGGTPTLTSVPAKSPLGSFNSAKYLLGG